MHSLMALIRRFLGLVHNHADVTDEETRQQVEDRLARQRARLAALDGRAQVQTSAKHR